MFEFDDLLEVLDGARRYEGYIASCCPFHDEDRPSFMLTKYGPTGAQKFAEVHKIARKAMYAAGAW